MDKPPLPEVYVYEAPKRQLVDIAPPPPPPDTRADDEARKKQEAEELDRKRRESLHKYEITTMTSDIKWAHTKQIQQAPCDWLVFCVRM